MMKSDSDFHFTSMLLTGRNLLNMLNMQMSQLINLVKHILSKNANTPETLILVLWKLFDIFKKDGTCITNVCLHKPVVSMYICSTFRTY